MWKPLDLSSRAGPESSAPAGGPSRAGWTGGWPAARAPAGGRPWKLFLNRDAAAVRTMAAADAAAEGKGVFVPPDAADLPLLLHRMGPLPEDARTVFVPDLHRAFPCRGLVRRPKRRAETPPLPAIATPAYLLARLARLGAEDRALIASAAEDEIVRRGPELLQGRGAACQLEVVREAIPPSGPASISGPGARELEAAENVFAVVRIALHAPDVVVRAKAAQAAVSAGRSNPVAHLLLGCSLAERRKPAGAARAFQAARERDPNFAAAHFELGKTMIVLDDLKAALKCFTRATETLPEFAPGWANMGASYGELEQPEDALAPLTQAAELDPLSHSLASNLGVTLRDLGRLPQAEAAFRRALQLAPDFVFGRYNLANAVYLQGRHQEAVDLFEEAVGMDPTGSARQKLLLAAVRLAAGDEAGSIRDYRAVFGSLKGRMRLDMKTVALWDLRRLAERAGLTPALRRVAGVVRAIRREE